MATTYNWDCKTVDTYPTHGGESDVVYNVHWRLTGTSDEVDSDGNAYTSTNIGTQSLSTDDLSGFTSFDSVVHSDVVGWVEDAMGADDVASLKASIQSSLDALVTPTSVTLTVADDPAVEE